MTGVSLSKGQADFPSRDSTSSYWHKDPSQKLLGHRTTTNLPSEADVVVIGSGITGSFLSRELVHGGRNVLLLEAREACWGATGRNGGHCQPMLYLTRPHVARFELGTYEFLEKLVSEAGVDCGWRAIGGVHGIRSEEALDLARRRIELLTESDPDLAATVSLVTDGEELERLRVRGERNLGAVMQEHAAKCWPYKLVSWVLEELLARNEGAELGFNLQTLTRVEHLQRLSNDNSSSSRWIVHTERGQVAARDVVLATNAYTSRLLPAFTGLITPVRGQVAALKPPRGAPSLAHTYVWALQEPGDAGESENYLVQSSSGGEELILGGERLSVPDGAVGVSRDDEIDPVVARRLRRALRSELQLRAGEEDPDELDAAFEWTGIMGYSLDGFPWVGKIPAGFTGGAAGARGAGNADGLWVSAGYTGHGMPSAARCGVAVAQRILGTTSGGVELPPEFEISEGRAEKARAGAARMPQTFVEELREAEEYAIQMARA